MWKLGAEEGIVFEKKQIKTIQREGERDKGEERWKHNLSGQG
jgi:hypothetical protein